MPSIAIQSLHLYPIKSLGGIAVDEAHVEARGLRFDRRFLVVDSTGRFLTQREHAKMALLRPAIEGDTLRISAPGQERLSVPLVPPAGESRKVVIWRDECLAQAVSAEADAWFSQALGIPCALVYMPEDTRRAVNPAYAPAGHIVSFADGYPVLIASAASLADLNGRLDSPVPMNRFRPNLVVTGCAPFAEDDWGEFDVGSVRFKRVKPCERCTVTTIDQDTARAAREPLATLSRYRKVDNKVLYGQNLIPLGSGVVRVGDPVVLA